ncbi:hypothetical protein [Streptomyces sp. NPDC050560]|uniref:hypothetical protein n=1 Tax=Streptomyces sp. NPDC050560 TaxID=3365630 RepID=UPI00379706D5
MRTVVLAVAEALCVLLVLYGVALVSVPAAVILGGLAGVAGIEVAAGRPAPARRRGKGAP